MYFSASSDGSSHLWRQKFPDGAAEQITFGPTDEEGIALAPDGRSLLTSIGTRRSAIWIHDAGGERAISSEGYAAVPRFSRDGTHVFYLLVRDFMASGAGWVPASAELRSVDVGSGKTDSVLPGVAVTDYDISPDEQEVAFSARTGEESEIWLAPLDRRTSPRLVARAGDSVSFGAGGHLVFRSLDGKTNSLVRIKKDGTGRERVTTAPILDKFGASPDGEWVIAYSPGYGEDGMTGTLAIPVRGGAPRTICARCAAEWSPDGKFFYVGSLAASAEQTLAIAVPAGNSLPDLPTSGIDAAAASVNVPGALVIKHGAVSPGLDPSTYLFTKTDLQRNLFRVPLH
jgi:Tol biopolymer transport system component